MIKTKDEKAALINETKALLKKIANEKPNQALQEDARVLLTKLKSFSLREKKSVIAQKIEHALNTMKKTERPSLFVQEILVKDALNLFTKNFE